MKRLLPLLLLAALPLFGQTVATITVTSDEAVAGVTVTQTGADAYTITLASTLSGVTAAAADLTQTTAPTGTLVLTPTGSGVLTGSYYYAVTFVTADGETSYGALSGPVAPSSQQVAISAIPLGGSGVTSRKIYRTVAGAQSYTVQYVATIADNTTTTYTDNTADGALGAYASFRNATGGALMVEGVRVFEVEPLEFLAIGHSAAPYGGAGIIAIGDYAGPQQPSTDHQSVYIGEYAGAATTTAAGDVSVGSGAGHSNATGHRNTRVGLNSGWYNASGWYNTLFGAYAGFSSTAGYGCTFLGYMAGYADLGDSLLRITVAKTDGTAQTLISGQGGASPSVSIGGTLSANNLSGTNTGDQDLTGYAQTDTAQTWTAKQTFWGGASFGGTQSSDTAPEGVVITAQSAYPHATTNKTGGDLYLGGGAGTLGFTVVDYSGLYGQSVGVRVDEGLPTEELYILTEGVHFSAQTSNAVTATNLAAAVNAWCPGAYATASGADVGVEKAPGAVRVDAESYTSLITAYNSDSGTCYVASPLILEEAATARGALMLGTASFTPFPADPRIYIRSVITRVSSSTAFSPTGVLVQIEIDDGGLVLLQFEDANTTMTTTYFPGLREEFKSQAGAWILLVYDSTDARFEELHRYPLGGRGTTAPSTTPSAIGLQYVDTAAGKVYISTGTASSADWKILN